MNRYTSYLHQFVESLNELDEWRASFDRTAGERENSRLQQERMDAESDRIGAILSELTARLKENYPFHHPRYAGQMLKPPHPMAWMAYSLAMSINPNNHSTDGSSSTTEMEKEVVAQLAAMVGYGPAFMGHLTSGGTIANLEALWVAREIAPDKGIAFSANAHYTHRRMCQILGIPFFQMPTDLMGRPDLSSIRSQVDRISTIVVTLGTTGLGFVEPLDEILDVARQHGLRIHVDAAYGGFFKLIAGREGIDPTAWDLMHEADSIVIDPHKHGLQPYGCGSILFKDPSVKEFYRHDSPYTYFTKAPLHLGEISLECSRPGASAAALWATLKLLPLRSENGLGDVLADSRRAAIRMADGVRGHSVWRLYCEPMLDIVTWFDASTAKTTSACSNASEQWLERKLADQDSPVYLSLYKVSSAEFCARFPDYMADTQTVSILRSVLMKPEHEREIEIILNRG